jgi:putative transposase
MGMSELYKNKYRIPSARAQWWDYGNNAAYFVTICTRDREHFFGSVSESQFIASPLGEIALSYWLEIPKHFSFARLDVQVIMPNHMHGILIIDKPETPVSAAAVETRLIASLPLPPATPITPPPQTTGGFAGNKNPMLNDNLARIVRWYKGRTSFEVRKIHADFAWQPRYHDHIIRSEQSYENISHYIINNPARWQEDLFYSA